MASRSVGVIMAVASIRLRSCPRIREWHRDALDNSIEPDSSYFSPCSFSMRSHPRERGSSALRLSCLVVFWFSWVVGVEVERVTQERERHICTRNQDRG